MIYIIYLFNLMGDKEEVGRFEDKLACETFAHSIHEQCQKENEKFNTLKSVHILNNKGQDCWKEIMG